MPSVRFTVDQPHVQVRQSASLEADWICELSVNDKFDAAETFIEEGIEWARLAAGCTVERAKQGEVKLDLLFDGFVPTEDPVQGTLLRKHAQIMVEERREEGALTKAEIQEIFERSSDPSLLLPLESKYWSKQQLEMFVMSGGTIRPAWCSVPDQRLMANTDMSQEDIARALSEAVDWIVHADAMLIGSGAGMGVDSGLGTFRGGQKGVWAGLDAVGLAYEEICHPKWFAEEPHLGWAFWNHCHQAYQATTPHEGYTTVRDWAAACPLGFYSFTSNIDSHWIASGTSAERVLEVHGAVRWLQCSKPCSPDVWKAKKDLELVEDPETHRVRGILPTCPKCRAVARPNVQMFGGDGGFSKARRGSQFSRYDAWLKQLEARPDKDTLRITCVELGCGVTVPTVRKELENVVRKFPQARLIRVNPENPGIATELSNRGLSLPLAAGLAIEELKKQVQAHEQNKAVFILRGDKDSGVELQAHWTTSVGRLLRLAEKEGYVLKFGDPVKQKYKIECGGQAFHKPIQLQLDSCIPAKAFMEVKAVCGSEMHMTVVIDLYEAVFFTTNEENVEAWKKGELRWNSLMNTAYFSRGLEVLKLLETLNKRYEEPAYQEEVRRCTDRRSVMKRAQQVHLEVLPTAGFEASEKGVIFMTSWISAVQRHTVVKAEVDKSMDLSYMAHRRSGHLPLVDPAFLEEAKKDRQKDRAQEPQHTSPPVARAQPLEVTVSTMPSDDGSKTETMQVDGLTTRSTVLELSSLLRERLQWTQEIAQSVQLMTKIASHGVAFEALRDEETVPKVVYVRGVLQLRAAESVEVVFTQMAPEDGSEAKTFSMELMSSDRISDAKNALGEALGWDEKTRKGVRFLIRMNRETFGGLKDHEIVGITRKVIFVHGAPLEPPEGYAVPPRAQAAVPTASATLEAPKDAPEMSPKNRAEPEQLRAADTKEETGETLNLVVVVSREYDFKLPVTINKGATIKDLKKYLATGDPTGAIDPDAFCLAIYQPRCPGRVFQDSEQVLSTRTLEVVDKPPAARSEREVPNRDKSSLNGKACKTEQGQAGPHGKLSIAGTFNNWSPASMRREGLQWVFDIYIGNEGWIAFKLLLNGNWDLAFYPSKKNAHPWTAHSVLGPDNKGHGHDWMIGDPRKRHERNVAKVGDKFKVIVEVDDQLKAKSVRWDCLSKV